MTYQIIAKEYKTDTKCSSIKVISKHPTHCFKFLKEYAKKQAKKQIKQQTKQQTRTKQTNGKKNKQTERKPDNTEQNHP